jgi:transcriptional regulator with XRE-family HTH domain
MDTATEQSPRNLTPLELAAVVRSMRDARTWSQEQLAEISGLSTRTVQRVEEDQPSSLDTRRALAAGLRFQDIDAFNKPYVIPTAEEMTAAKERFDREHVTLKVERVQTGKQLATLVAGRHAFHFSEAFDLPERAEDVFAGLTDYCREYGDCAELYSATDKLAVFDEMNTCVANLASDGVCLAAATRAVVLKSEASAPAARAEILYVVAFPANSVPDNIAVARQVGFS